MTWIDPKYYKFNVTDESINFYMLLQVSADKSIVLKASIDEYEKLKEEIGMPKKVLDIGCGIGRSSVFLRNMMDLEDTMFYLADFNENIQYRNGITGIPLGYFNDADPKPFNNIEDTKRFCEANNLNNIKIIDLGTNAINKLRDIDVVYSFHAVGYHWSVKEAVYTYSLECITSKDAKAIFGVRNRKVIEKEPKTIYQYPEDTIYSFKKIKSINGCNFQDYWIYEKFGNQMTASVKPQ